MNTALLTTETAPASVQPLLESVSRKYGFVPNTYGVLAHSPLAVHAYLTLTDLIGTHSGLTPQEQQVVMLSVSAENGCEYCVAAHTVVAGMYKTPADAVAAIRSGTAPADARLAALASFTRSVVKNRGWVPESEQQAFLDAGFSVSHVFDVLTILALKTLSNYANHLGNPPLDAAFAAAAWHRPCADCQGAHRQ